MIRSKKDMILANFSEKIILAIAEWKVRINIIDLKKGFVVVLYTS